jgi:rhomboid protease GluP
MFLRYENFREYIRYYPVNTAILAVLVTVHAGFELFSFINEIPVYVLKQLFGGFLKVPEEGIVPEYWRYIASVFMHADFGHLLFNAFSVFVFAPPLERLLGPLRYAALFLFSGVMGNIFTNFYEGTVFSVGASGAVYGVLGAYFYFMLFHRHSMDVNSRRTLQTLIVIGVVYSVIVPQINVYAHLGGFIGGFVLNGLYTKVLQGRNH